MTTPVIVAIDGPSGVGKTTTGRLVAARLGLPHIDTGAMYRAVALKAMRAGVPLDDPARLSELASRSTIDFIWVDGRARTVLDGEDVSEAIREPRIGLAASTVSAVSSVRRVLVALQQEIGVRAGGVLEGRDIGTKVFPGTPFKFFLTARPEVRAERRFHELVGRGTDARLDDVRTDLGLRDDQDSNRADSPLRCDETYHCLDTSDLSLDQVVETIVEAVNSYRDDTSP